MAYKSSDEQLLLQLFEVLVRERISTRDLYLEMKTKLPKHHQRRQIVQQLDRQAARGENFEIMTPEGAWVARSIGKTSTGRYLWNCYFRPKLQIAA